MVTQPSHPSSLPSGAIQPPSLPSGAIQPPSLARVPGGLTPEEGRTIALALNNKASTSPLYAETQKPVADGRHTSWRLAPEPYALRPEVYQQVQSLGRHLLAFMVAANKLYLESVKGRQPVWVHLYLDRGKPESLIEYQRMNRFKQALPRVIRPDLVINEDGTLSACELDSVPGGIGFTGRMTQDYAEHGYAMIGGNNGLVTGFADMIRDVAGQAAPILAIVVSDESTDYWLEQRWLARELCLVGLETVAIRPGELHYDDDGLSVETAAGRRHVDVIYRFFELFDLKNVPKSELIQYANKKEQVIVTPPFKAFMEEKMLFALFHHPVLAAYWRQELGHETYAMLERLLPRTWIVDPTPLPPHAVIPGLMIGTTPLTDWLSLLATNKRERSFVLKPSGFSSLAWGSHGVAFGHDLSVQDWETALRQAMQSFPQTPYVLQEFAKPEKTAIDYFHFGKDAVVTMEGRARFCPYYFVAGGQANLHGILTTICPLDKLALHGMTDAVMVPTVVGS